MAFLASRPYLPLPGWIKKKIFYFQIFVSYIMPTGYMAGFFNWMVFFTGREY